MHIALLFKCLLQPVLIFFQRRNFHQGPFRIGPMNGLAVVSQSLLRELLEQVKDRAWLAKVTNALNQH